MIVFVCRSPAASEDFSLEVLTDSLLQQHTSNTTTNNPPQPRVLNLFAAGPEAILLLRVPLKLLELLWAGRAVSAALRCLRLTVAADVAEVDVICCWTEEGKRVKHAASVQEEWEGGVNKGIAKVAVIS